MAENAVPDVFLRKKIKIEHISVKFYSFFLLHVQVEGYRKILQLRCRPLALIPFLNVFKKQKELWSWSPFLISCMTFEEYLKELRNTNERFSCVRHKNRRKHNQYFKTAVFHNKFTLCHIKQIST